MNSRMTLGQLSQSALNESIHIQAYHGDRDGECYLLTNIMKSYEGIMAQPVMDWYIAGNGFLIASVDLPEKMMKVLEDI